jgi:peroxiredoxin
LALLLLGGIGRLWLAPATLSRAPDVSLTTLQGQTLTMAALRGRPVLVNFWATSCTGCVAEIPELVELYGDFAAQGLEIIGIAMAYDRPDQVLAFTRARHIPYPVALDINQEAARAFGDVQLTPTSFLFAPDGRLARTITGALDMPALRAQVAGMLKTAAGDAHGYPVN